MHNNRYRLLAWIGLLCAGVALAAPKAPEQYQIEVIIYSQLTPESMASEYWTPALPDSVSALKRTISLSPATDTPLEDYPTLTELPETSWLMRDDAERLQKQLSANIIYHEAWRETRAELDRNPPAIIISNQPAPAPTTNSEIDSDLEPTPAPSYDTTHTRLDGWLKLRLNRYFDAHFHLAIAEPSKKVSHYLPSKHSNCAHQDWCYFTLNAKRRTRSNVMNYVDHPLYGILYQITPVPSE